VYIVRDGGRGHECARTNENTAAAVAAESVHRPRRRTRARVCPNQREYRGGSRCRKCTSSATADAGTSVPEPTKTSRRQSPPKVYIVRDGGRGHECARTNGNTAPPVAVHVFSCHPEGAGATEGSGRSRSFAALRMTFVMTEAS